MQTAERQQLHICHAHSRWSIKTVLDSLKKQRCDEYVKLQMHLIEHHAALLERVRGVGTNVAVTLISESPELGAPTRR